MPADRIVRGVLLGLLALVAVNALVAGPLLVADPDGRFLGMPVEDLEGSPFTTYRGPGVLLTGLGLAQAAAVALQLRRHPQAWFWSGFAASALVVWIVVQLFIIEPFFLQPILGTIGAAQGLLALAQWRRARAQTPA